MSIRRTCLWATLVVAVLFANSAEGKQFRIVGGRAATSEMFPYQVELERMEKHWCGGAIIHSEWVLTAAHCVHPYSQLSPIPPQVLRVRVGNDLAESGGFLYSIQTVISHEGYDDNAEVIQHDIALLKMNLPFHFNSRVKTVLRASRLPPEGSLGFVVGFGRQKFMRATNTKRTLNAVELPLIYFQRCQNMLPNIDEDMVCAGHLTSSQDSCVGDSGGPYVIDGKLTGLVSWGIGCGRKGYPGVYTNVVYYRDWIDSFIDNSYDSYDLMDALK